MRRMQRVAGIGAVAAVAGTLAAWGMMIAVGLDWRQNYFIQEYWQDGKPFFLIANQTDTDNTVAVTDHKAQGPVKTLAGPWPVKAHQIVTVDATALVGQELVGVQLGNGTGLGLVNAPVAPPAELKATGLLSTYGLNGSGGRQLDAWVETQGPLLTGGTTTEVRLHLPASAGELVITKENNPGIKVAAEGLKVVETAKDFTLDVQHPAQAAASYTVVLTLPLPAVKQPTMVVLDTWLWAPGRQGGHGVTRGLAVLPAPAAAAKP